MMHHTLLTAILVSGLIAQDQAGQDQKKPATQPTANAKAAIEAWLTSENNRSLCEKAVIATLQERERGIELLASMLPKEGAAPEPGQEKRQKAIDTLLQTYLAAFLQVQLQSGMQYAGQYAAMRKLMPFSGKAYLKFLMETPDWFHEDLRIPTVAALRDLYTEAPGESPMNELRKVAKDEEFEREALREAVAYALARWGDREFADKRLTAMKKEVENAKPEDKYEAQHKLADAYYALRDYDKAAAEWREMFAQAEKSGRTVVPNDYYNAACNMSLAGDVEGSLATIEKCLKIQGGGGVDPSRRVDEKLFRLDPDLANVRKNPRFAEIVKEAFSKGSANKDGDKKDAREKKNESAGDKK